MQPAIVAKCASGRSIAASIKELDRILNDHGVTHAFEIYDGDHTNHVADRIVQKMIPLLPVAGAGQPGRRRAEIRGSPGGLVQAGRRARLSNCASPVASRSKRAAAAFALTEREFPVVVKYRLPVRWKDLRRFAAAGYAFEWEHTHGLDLILPGFGF